MDRAGDVLAPRGEGAGDPARCRARTGRAGAGRWRASRRGPVAGSSASAPFASSSFRNCWVSASSEARISSGFTCGWVEASGIVEPSLTSGADWVPGSTSTTMSLRPVFGRSSSEALAWISGAYLLSISMLTTAWPSSSVTPVTSPTLMPAMSTDWPWPGVTACAVEKSALSSKRSVPISGTQLGQDRALVDQDHGHGEQAGQDQADDRQHVAEVCSQGASHGYGAGSAGPGWPPARSGRGSGCSGRRRRCGREARSRRRAACRSAGSVEPPQSASCGGRTAGRRRAGSGPGRPAGPRRRPRRSAARGRCRRRLGLTGEPGRRVAELLVVRHAGREVVSGARVVQDDVAGREQHVVHAAAEQADLGEERPAPSAAALPAPGPASAQLARDVAELVLAEQRRGLVDPGLRGGDRGRQLPDPRGEVERRRCAGTAASRWCGAATARRSGGSGRAA